MSKWRGSTRKASLPSNWKTLRRQTFERDGWRCVQTLMDGTRCTKVTDLECDHMGDREDHSLANLRTLCHTHHLRRSGSQGGRSAATGAALRRKRSRREPETHPGLLTTGERPPWMGRINGGATTGTSPQAQ